MYPSFNADSRIELFCRGQYHGWTCVGYEAGADTIDDNDGDANSVEALYELAEIPEVREEIERRIAAGELATIEDVRTVKTQIAEIVAKGLEYAGTIDRLRKKNRDLMASLIDDLQKARRHR
jgi:hypothetical protein